MVCLFQAGADIDLDYISSLLLSDSNPTDMLMPSEVQVSFSGMFLYAPS